MAVPIEDLYRDNVYATVRDVPGFGDLSDVQIGDKIWTMFGADFGPTYSLEKNDRTLRRCT